MKINYDISVLGTGYYCPRARTGVFRVVENIAYGLIASKECELVFCASESFQKLNESLDYLEYNLRFQGVSLPCAKLVKLRRVIYREMRAINRTLNDNNNVAYYKFLFKGLEKLLYYADRLIGIYSTQLIPDNILLESDIFHFPFYPIPYEVKKAKSKTIFVTLYDLIPILYPHFFKFKEDYLIKKTLESLDSETWVICISHATKNDLCNYLDVDASRVFVTHLAASELFYPCSDREQKLSISKKYSIPDIPYILSLSTLEPRKNLDLVIKSFVKLVLQENIKDLNLVLVGPKGWDYAKIFEELANHNHLKERIIITGYVADADLAAVYSNALAFVYPSLYEGFGLPPLEAMQCGVPVITSNTSSLPEVVSDAGIMIPPTDVDALCHNMLEIYNRPSLREAMSLKSIERAKQFSWQKCTQETIAAYKTALSS